MIGTLITLIFMVLIMGFIWWAAQRLLALITLAEPFATILSILLYAVIFCVVLWVLWQLVQASGIMSASLPSLNLHGK